MKPVTDLSIRTLAAALLLFAGMADASDVAKESAGRSRLSTPSLKGTRSG